MENIEEMVKKLPPELRQEVEDFVNFLIEKKSRKHGRKLRQDWGGALKDYRDEYTSLELQKKALEWRGDWIVYLIDTNIWLERFLDQDRAEEVSYFLDRVPPEHLFITDFKFHSIGVVLSKLDRKDALLRSVQDTFIEGAISLIHLDPEDIQLVVRKMEQLNLDFDDAYQYSAAEKYNLTNVSFDSDFDRTLRGRKTPAEIK